MSQIKCIKHPNQSIFKICLNKDCLQDKYPCINCYIELHTNHEKDCLDVKDQLPQYIQERKKQAELINQKINDLENSCFNLRKFQEQIQEKCSKNLQDLNKDELKDLINQSILIQERENRILKIIEKAKFKIDKEANLYINQDQKIPQQQKKIQKNKEKQDNYQGTPTLQGQDYEQAKQEFKFYLSDTLKGKDIQIYKQIIIQKQENQFGLLEPQLSLNQENIFKFKVLQIYKQNYIPNKIGVCSLDYLKRSNYTLNTLNSGHKAYLIYGQNNVYTPKGQKLMPNQKFCYKQNQIVTVIANLSEQRLTMINETTGEKIDLDLEFQNLKDPYFCINNYYEDIEVLQN